MDFEWIILADAAQVVNNKLSLLGGGWEALTVNSGFPADHRFAIATSLRVPWNETNQRHRMSIEVHDADGSQLAAVSGQIEVGRPPGIRLGQAQRVQLAVDLAIRFEQPGTYVIIGRIEDQELQRTTFEVAGGPSLTAIPPPS